MKKHKIVKQKIKTEFIDNDMKYVSEPATMMGSKGNYWTVSKRIDSEWVLLGKMFSTEETDKNNIIDAASCFFTDQRKKFIIVGIFVRFIMAVENIMSRCLNIFRKILNCL
jgi:hypothetical protein